MKRELAARLALTGALCLLCACSQLLEIEDAHVDADLESDVTGTGSANQSTSSGGGPSAGSSGGGNGSQSSQEGRTDTPEAGRPSGGDDSGPTPTGAAGAPSEPSLCERYCDAVSANCKGKYEQFRTFDQCVEVCKRLPPGEAGDDDSNTIECRRRQAEFAESEPFVYCKSAGPLGGGRCGSNCVSYCSMMQVSCTAESTAGNLEPSYFASLQECLDACNVLPPDDTGPQQYSSSASAEPASFVGNNIYCRTYHLAAALEQGTPDEHCPHAMGGDPCIVQ